MSANQDGDCAGPSVPTEFIFVKGPNNKQELIRGNRHHFLHHSSKDGTQMWKCKHTKTCGAKLKIMGQRIIREDRHTCSPKNLAASAMLKKDCHKKVTTSHIPITKIYQQAVKRYVDAGYDLIDDIPTFDSIKSSLYRERNKSLDVTKTTFKLRKDVEIPAQYRDFLLFDHNEEDRILIFSSTAGRKVIQESEVFFFDGTFYSCSSPFYQLYSMHADVGSNDRETNIMPVLFALLPNKLETTYVILFNTIRQNLQGWKPCKVIVDFELAVINAFRTCLPDTEIKGCNFHFRQALTKKARYLNISTKEEKDHVSKCAALAHLPLDDVDDGWLAIMEIAPENEKITLFNDYFVDFWLNNPSIPIRIWNCEGERHRTTNLVEAWHKTLNGQLKRKPRLLELLHTLREQADYYEKYHLFKKNRTRYSINKDFKIKIIGDKYKQNSISIIDALNKFSGLDKVP